jgi:type II secretory pathway pseudopilin PulG
VQVVIAVAIMGIAYIPASSIFIASTRTVQKGDLRLTATLVAQTIIDELRLNQEIFTATNQEYILPAPKFGAIDVPLDFKKNYQAKCRIHVVRDDTYPKRLRKLTVYIDYSEYSNPRTVVVSTLVGDIRNIHLRSWK